MKSGEEVTIAGQADQLLRAVQHPGEGGSPATADDLLVFLYRLRDEYRIVRSTSSRFKGSSFSFLHELLYQLESRPEKTLRSTEWMTFVEVLLSDIASDRIHAENT